MATPAERAREMALWGRSQALEPDFLRLLGQKLEGAPSGFRLGGPEMARLLRRGQLVQALTRRPSGVFLLPDDPTQARLGLVAAAHAGRWGVLVQALAHPSPRVSSLAVGLLPRHPKAVRAAAERLEALSPRLRRRLLDRVREVGLAEEFLPSLDRPWEQARLLPGCSRETVARRLSHLAPWVNWKRMASRHPEPTLAWIGQGLEAGLPDLRTRGAWSRALAILVHTHPSAALPLALQLERGPAG